MAKEERSAEVGRLTFTPPPERGLPAAPCGNPNTTYTFHVYRFFTPLLRRLYVLLGAFLFVYGSVLLVENSEWNKERLYRKLISGEREEKLAAVADLIYFKGQVQLVRALQSKSVAVRSIAISSLWDLWFHAGGEEAFQMIKVADQAAERGAIKEALAVLTSLTQEYPDFAEGWNRRGTLYWQLGKDENAIADARKVIALNPDHFGAWQGMGMCQLRLGDWASASKSFRAALKINPHDRSLRDLLWRCEELFRRSPSESQPHSELI